MTIIIIIIIIIIINIIIINIVCQVEVNSHCVISPATHRYLNHISCSSPLNHLSCTYCNQSCLLKHIVMNHLSWHSLLFELHLLALIVT